MGSGFAEGKEVPHERHGAVPAGPKKAAALDGRPCRKHRGLLALDARVFLLDLLIAVGVKHHEIIRVNQEVVALAPPNHLVVVLTGGSWGHPGNCPSYMSSGAGDRPCGATGNAEEPDSAMVGE